MRVFEIREGFGLDHLVPAEREKPSPGPGRVLLRMRAVSLNYRDYLMVTGAYNPKQPLPLVPCSDGVGVVEALGPGVRGLEVGQRVSTLFAPRWQAGAPSRDKVRTTLGGPLDGALTEFMVLDASAVCPVPAYLSDVEAATLPCAALTAWSALVAHGRVKAGDTVLVQGTGGVSLFALQIAGLLGARVIVTSSKQEKLERALDLGAWKGLHYVEDPEWGRSARALTGGAGVDHVVDVGGGSTLAQSLKAVRVGGTISLIGILGGTEASLALTPILMQNVRIQGILVGHRESFEALCRAFAAHEVEPVIDRVFPFDETREALAYLAAGRHFGKICIEL
ncbi:MAG: NAD(P)-dependent alcohol dehydrogenase [Holophagales bacterium]|nr:NAD(P)-dependent alcohol dehydrogenase [Holophagales bacterium]